jgi:3-hydroxyisobutyrate dehydrogenase-like beta-hydroxyacid dehydrogenase
VSELTIGFIGLGNQGGPIAHRIVDGGRPLMVWARRPQVLEAYVAKGARAAASIAAVGAHCDHVGICVVNDADVVDVCRQLIPAMRPGSRIAIHSTVLPETCIALDQECAEHGIELIDAPVSGGAAGAQAGTLTVMCGGTQQVFDACRPVFETFGKLIVRVGPTGAGQRAKIINNALLAANIALAHAALSAGETLGLDRATLAGVIRGSSGYSFGVEVSARFASPGAFAQGARLLVKDVGLLQSILPHHAGAEALHLAAHPYLTEATQGAAGAQTAKL